MKAHRYTAIVGALAAAFTLTGPTYGQIVQIPTNYSTPLYEAALKFVEDMHVNETMGTWQILPTDNPSTGYGVYVSISSAYGTQHSLDPTGYKFEILPGSGGDGIQILTPTEEGAVDAMHSLRLHYQSLGLNGNGKPEVPPRMNKSINPAFVRRGFMALPGRTLTIDEWKEYVDYHRLLGANTLTVPSALFDQTDDRTARFEFGMNEVALLQEHCKDIGVKFQLLSSGNLWHAPYYWDHYRAEPGFYDMSAATPFASDDTSWVADPLGAEANHGTHTYHESLYYPPAASLSRVSAAGKAGELQTLQDTFYETFEDADSFVLVTTEANSDYGELIMVDPILNWVHAQFDWVQARRKKMTSDVIYWAWLHDIWIRSQLFDPNYGAHSISPYTLDTFETLSVPAAVSQLLENTGSAEWIQETGAYYEILQPYKKIVNTTTDQLKFVLEDIPDSFKDPLGELDQQGVDITAFLYWCHVETDIRNYNIRPAIRSVLVELRAALRKRLYVGYDEVAMKDIYLPEFFGGPTDMKEPATGVMGYRFGTLERRPLNDYVLLRCASDRSYLGLDKQTIDETELDELRDDVIVDMAKFIAYGKTSIHTAVKDSITKLDDARKLGENNPDPQLLADSLEDLSAVAWWGDAACGSAPCYNTPRLQDYYHLLAFAVFTERAASLGGDPLIDAALEVARRTPLLDEYAGGDVSGQARAKIEALVGSL
jgi:hypothetical protein